MSDRVTIADLDAMLERYRLGIESAGLPSDGMELHIGSATYKYAFRLVDAITGRAPIGPTNLGYSKRDAFGTLETICETLEDTVGVLADHGPRCVCGHETNHETNMRGMS